MKKTKGKRPLKTHRIFLFFLLTAVPFITLSAVYGENNKVQDIRAQYNKIKKEIGTGFLYHDRMVINPEDRVWPSLGNYRATYDVY